MATAVSGVAFFGAFAVVLTAATAIGASKVVLKVIELVKECHKLGVLHILFKNMVEQTHA